MEISSLGCVAVVTRAYTLKSSRRKISRIFDRRCRRRHRHWLCNQKTHANFCISPGCPLAISRTTTGAGRRDSAALCFSGPVTTTVVRYNHRHYTTTITTTATCNPSKEFSKRITATAASVVRIRTHIYISKSEQASERARSPRIYIRRK